MSRGTCFCHLTCQVACLEPRGEELVFNIDHSLTEGKLQLLQMVIIFTLFAANIFPRIRNRDIQQQQQLYLSLV